MEASEQSIPQEAVDALFAVLVTRGSPRAAIAAALNAWPGAVTAEQITSNIYDTTLGTPDAIILPLGDDK